MQTKVIEKPKNKARVGGNILSKTGLGAYTYGSARPLAVTGVENTGYVIQSASQHIDYNPWGKASRIEEGQYSQTLRYGPDRQRWKVVDSVGGRFTTMDPLCEKYYSISPYAYCMGNPMKYVDENGDSVRMIFNKDTQELHILDMDYYNPKKKLEYVTYNDYTIGKENQVLVIPFVFSGGEIGEEGNVVVNPRYSEYEIGLPNGVYDILDNSSDTNPHHYSWYRLDINDNYRYDDMDDKTGRIGFRLHLGTRSFGCVTINKNQNDSNAMWNVLTGIMNRTKTSRVKEKRGRQWLNPFNYRTWYGKMAVIGGE